MRNKRVLLLLLLLVPYLGLMMWVFMFLLGALLTTQSDGADFKQLIVLMFSPWEWDLTGPETWVFLGLPVGALVMTQFLFLLPTFRIAHPRAGRARSLRATIISSGLVAAVLAGGLFAAIIGLAQYIGTYTGGSSDPSDVEPAHPTILVIALVLTAGTSWLIWSLVLMGFARRRHGHGVLSRIIGILLGGTVAEMLVVLPLDIMVRRKTNCYCGTGTFWTLLMSGWALLWLTGPGVAIALFSKRRDPWWDSHCESCGYEKGPSPSPRCPECGHEWITTLSEPAS